MLFTTLAVAAALNSTQQINCSPKDSLNTNDRVVMSFAFPGSNKEIPETGTLFLSSGFDDYGNQESSDVMTLAHIPENDEEASKGLVLYQASNDASVFNVTISDRDLGKTIKSFEMGLELKRKSDGFKVVQDL